MSKVFLSIGSGPGIGLATARRFAREGFDIVLAARNTERLQASADEIAIGGGRAVVQRVDASDPAAIAELVRSVGPNLHTLHYNAGVLHYDAAGRLTKRTLEDESVASLASDTSINITSALAAVHAAAPVMSARGSGTVLLTGGGLGVHPSGDFLTLSVGKAGLRAIGQALFEPMKARGIHVAMVTVSRLVSPASEQTAAIADAFWALHAQPRDAWTLETVYS